jgi:5-methylcytosine-specific restriction endonuclease McrA
MRGIKPVRLTARNAFSPERYGEAWEKVKHAMPLRGAYCEKCGSKCKLLQRDHLVPVSKGGNHTRSNASYICLKCHENKHPHMARRRIRKIKVRKFARYHL